MRVITPSSSAALRRQCCLRHRLRPSRPPRRRLPPSKLSRARQLVKKSVLLFLSATVYDRNVTEVRGFGTQGEYRIFSNIDFNLLAGLGGFETPDTSYSLLMGLPANRVRQRVCCVGGKGPAEGF